MELNQDIAVILKTIPYQERDRIVSAITKQNGLVSAIAKNSIQSRRFGGSLNLFNISEWSFRSHRENSLLFLTSAEWKKSFSNIEKNFEKLSLASFFNETLLKTAPKNQNCPEFFQLHVNALQLLNEFEGIEIVQRKLILINAYWIKILQSSGHQPKLHACFQCNVSIEEAEGDLSCMISTAAWLCIHCQKKKNHYLEGSSALQNIPIKIRKGGIEDLKKIATSPIRQVFEDSKHSLEIHQAVFKWLESLLLYHIPGFDGTPMKSFRFLI